MINFEISEAHDTFHLPYAPFVTFPSVSINSSPFAPQPSDTEALVTGNGIVLEPL
jgi:hypothetical protein